MSKENTKIQIQTPYGTKTIDCTWEITYLAGYNVAGDKIYVDKRFEPKLTLKDGRVMDCLKYLIIHEATEKHLEDTKGYKYQAAHEAATGAERKAVEADGYPWNEYQKYMLKEVDRLKKLDPKAPLPKDYDTKPEKDYHDYSLLREIKRHQSMSEANEIKKSAGALAEGKSLEDIAAHHKVDLSTIEAQVKKGIPVEKEHGDDEAKALSTVKDHLWENPKYYDYLEDMEEKMDEAKKCDDKTIAGQTKEVVMPDGKVERTFPGERLAKPIKKSLKETWDLLKAKISANDAFLPLEFFTGPDEKPEGQDQPQEGQDQGQPAEEQPAEGQESTLSPEEEAQLKQVKPEDVAPEEGQEDQGQNTQESQLSPEEEQQLNQVKPEDVAPEGQPQQEPEQGEKSRYYKGMSQKEMAQKMLEDGHSEQEVLYAIKGHIPYSPTMDDHKAETEKLMGQQKVDYAAKEAEAKHNHLKEIHDIEKKRKLAELESMDPEFTKEHQKKLKEVELERAKKALDAEDHEGEKAHKAKLRDLELQAKKEELEAKSSKQKLEYEKKMQELEYHKKKLEIELDIEYKRKENELKLQQKKEMLKQSTVQKKEIADVKHEANKSEAVSGNKEGK